jgi:hypothetical protein
MKRVPTIIEAMTSARLFGAMYDGPTWKPWHAVLKAAFGLPMDDEEAAFFRLVAGNREPSGKRCKELVLAIGRRGGKDAIAALICAHAAIAYRPDGRVRAGERPLILLLGADRLQAQNLLRYVRGLFDIKALAGLIQRETRDGFELSNGIDIFVGTADWRTIRGRTVLLCIANEIAFWMDENSSNPDREIIAAVRPAMATLADQAMLVMISSVYRKSGVLFDRWEKFYGRNDPNTLVVQGSTLAFNATIASSVVDDAMADDAAVAGAEYESRWREDLAGYLTRDQIKAVVDKGITVRPPQRGVQYQAWVDASSGQGKDSMCASIGHRGDNISIVDHVIEHKPPFKPSDAVAQIAATFKAYGITRVTGDKWALGFVATEFERHGITLEHSDKPGSELYRQCRSIITSLRCRLPDNDRMVGQFSNLEVRALPGGNERIDHPRGGHDDLSMVVAGLLVALSTELRGAAAWIEFYRRMVEEPHHFARFNTDRDDIRAPGPDLGAYSFTSEPLINVVVPEPIASTESGMLGRSFRRKGHNVIVEMTRSEARERLVRPGPWRTCNEALAQELEGAA